VFAGRGDHDALFARIVAQPGDPRLLEAPHERSLWLLGWKVRSWTRVRRRVLAGGTVGLAGVGAALVLALSGSAPASAFAITSGGDGSVLVKISRLQSLPAANRQLTAMGIHEQVTIFMARGATPPRGPVTCIPKSGANRSGPPLKVLVGEGGTEVGKAAGVIGVDAYHLDHCVVSA
jgi:hypothetical protein